VTGSFGQKGSHAISEAMPGMRWEEPGCPTGPVQSACISGSCFLAIIYIYICFYMIYDIQVSSTWLVVVSK